MDLVREMLSYMKARQRFWMLPILTLLLALGGLLLLAEGTVIAPFIYTIF